MNKQLLNVCIDNFINYLNQNFDILLSSYELHKIEIEKSGGFLVSFSDFFDDWTQANWELLVERVVCSTQETLTVYGSGSDYEAAAHSRVFFHKANATHEVRCISEKATDWITDEDVDLSQFEFEGFVSVANDWFEVSPPFDHILLTKKEVKDNFYQQVVIPRAQVVFIPQLIKKETF